MNRAMFTRILFILLAAVLFGGCAQTTPLSPGDADCAGILGGDAVEDACGVCGGDSSTCADCAGEPNGEATLDVCGVCDGDGTSCLDCAGEPNGEALEDDCGVCGGDGSSCADCAGEPNGVAVEDDCGVCGGDNSSCADCHGEPNGDALEDACGICGGDGSTCLDCEGVPNGGAVEDVCGVCSGDGTSCLDCAGTPNGTSITDECGVCEGDGSSCWDCQGVSNGDAVEDVCGVCGGDGTTCLDCAGTPLGDAVEDACGVCGGDGSTCGDFVVIQVEADAYVSSYSTSTNYGSSEEVRVDRYVDDTYLRFDLSALPAGATIHTVALQMWAYHGFAYGDDGNVYTYLVEDDSWDEYQINWLNMPSYVDGPLGHWWLWYNYSDYTLKSARLENDTLAQAVEAELAADGAISMRLHSPGYRTNYRSREFSDETMRPRLEVTYDDCAGVPSGLAYVDSCGACVGGTTGLEETTCPDDGGDDTPDTDDVTVGTGTVTLSKQGSCGHSDVVAACEAGSVAVGYQGNTGWWFDNVRLYCRVLEADGTLGAASLSGQNGTSNGGNSEGPYVCPEGQVMVGGQVRAGDHLDYLRGHCLSVDDVLAGTGGYSNSLNGMGNSSGGYDYGSQVCPAGHAVTGMVGGNTQYACRIAWQCSPIGE